MTTLIIPTTAEEHFLDLLTAVGYTLKLYTNDVTTGLTAAQKKALTAASFTEATFAGYAAKTLTGGSWTTTQADPSIATYAQQTFTRSSTGAAQTIYGYFVTRTSDGLLRWFEPFAGPITVTLINDAIKLTPTLTLDDDPGATVTARGIIMDPFLSTVSSSAYTSSTTTDITLVSVPVDSTRVYRVHFHSAWTLSAAGRWLIMLQENLTDVARVADITLSAIGFGVISSSVLWYPATGTPTLTIYAFEETNGASFTFEGGSTTPRYLWVEDVGER